MPGAMKNDEALKPGPDQNVQRNEEPADDTEGHSFIMDTETNRTIAREREKEIQRNLKTESRRPFWRRGR